MKLSEIKEQLVKCESIGVWEFCKTTEYASLFIPAVDYDIVPLELGRNGNISRTVQCLLVEALEQFSESRGYWFEFGKTRNIHYVWILSPDDDDIERQKANAPTRLQAVLNAFLEIDWSK